MLCPNCGKTETISISKFSYDLHRCPTCKSVFKKYIDSGSIEILDEDEVESRSIHLEELLQSQREFRTSSDVVQKRTYNEWLSELMLLDEQSAKEILKHLHQMEYKREGEVWLDKAPKGWRD